jgi:hypothetical protein
MNVKNITYNINDDIRIWRFLLIILIIILVISIEILCNKTPDDKNTDKKDKEHFNGKYSYYNPFGNNLWNKPTRMHSYYWPYLYHYPEEYPSYYIYS